MGIFYRFLLLFHKFVEQRLKTEEYRLYPLLSAIYLMDEYQAFTADIIRKLSEILISVISTIHSPKAKIRSEITWPHIMT